MSHKIGLTFEILNSASPLRLSAFAHDPGDPCWQILIVPPWDLRANPERPSMPFNQLVPRKFTSASVQFYAPASPGVYGISNARGWLYIGLADDIRSVLHAHLRDGSSSLMRSEPAGFVYEVCYEPQRTSRQRRLVAEYGPAFNP